jgi:hypothetical protein
MHQFLFQKMMSAGRPCLFFFERLSARKELRSGLNGKRGIGQVQLSVARLLAIFPRCAIGFVGRKESRGRRCTYDSSLKKEEARG